MKRVEQTLLKDTDPRFKLIDDACFASKHLYNYTLYHIRQLFFAGKKVPTYAKMAKTLKQTEPFKALPAKVAQWVVRQVCQDWWNFWKAHRAYKKNPAKFTGKPALPHYKDKTAGRNLLVYTTQALSKPALQEGVIQPSRLAVVFQTKQTNVKQVRFIPKRTHIVLEVVYETQPVKAKGLKANKSAAIDLGVDTLAAVISNVRDLAPLLINGRPLKTINAFYNKRKAALQSQLAQGQYHSHRLDRLTDKRNRRVKAYLHWASRHVIDWCVANHIGVLVIGKNKFWKQNVEMGKQSNQKFVCIPHSMFIDQLKYKAELVGIKVIVQEESYSSKCSWLDLEPVRKHKTYLGQRIRRGEFVSAKGVHIHADVNGSLNIMRKAIPTAFGKRGIKGIVVCPVRVSPVQKL
jgi:putative transposase